MNLPPGKMGTRVRKISFKSKVISEMEILEKPERIITRYFQEARHVEDIVGIQEESEERDVWRKYSKDRMKTVSVALVFCLHIGVEPPDSIPKPAPCAKLEGWVDPFACHSSRALSMIATSVQKSYERWQPRARYKVATDPTTDDVRKLCLSMRRNAKEERVLFHYNGHGVPRPTANGEIWVFNKNFTQYIPLSVFDLQTWMEYPSIYVWDCSSAETIVNSFNRFGDDHEREWSTELQNHQEQSSHPLPIINSQMTMEQQAEALRFRKKPRYKDCIQLAACRVDERLPTNPDLPADLFTSCLTTPIQTSILWYLIRSGRRSQFATNILEEIPGSLGDRRTILGELNWIFTAITDTIAWNSLPKEDFQRLFRQDLLLASLFRSFILAEKIMGENGCGVVSAPALPSTSDHPLWDSWEYTLDLTLNYIQMLKEKERCQMQNITELLFSRSRIVQLNTMVDLSGIINDAQELQHNWFFVEQLRAFEVWLEYGSEKQKPPQQLPIVLQVLLSQAHRLRALELLARFLDLGQWAVAHSLSVGVFPYVQKLLQSNTKELRQWLAFIWAKILAVDPTCQTELFKENGDDTTPRFENHRRPKPQLRYFYFVQILNDPETTPRQKIVPAFILATLFHNNYRVAQENLTDNKYVNLCTELLSDPATKDCRLLKLWVLIGLGRLWADFDKARWQAVRLDAYSRVLQELDDMAPEVRAAAVYSLGCLVKNRSEDNEHASYIDQQLCDELCNKCTLDGSILVRVELVVALQYFIIDFEQRFAKMLLLIAEKLEMKLVDGHAKEDGEMEDNEAVDIAATIPIADPDKLARSDRSRRRKHNSESQLPEEIVCMEMQLERNGNGKDSRKAIPDARAHSADEAFRERARMQIRYLELKNFHEPMERTWLALLRLSLDPSLKVAHMAQELVRHIERLAIAKRTAVDQKISSLHIDNMTNSLSGSPLEELQDIMPQTGISSHFPRIGNGSSRSAAVPLDMMPEHGEAAEQSRSADDQHKGGVGVMFVVGSPAGPGANSGGSLSARGADRCETPLGPPPQRKHSMPAGVGTTPRTPRGESRLSREVANQLARPGYNFTPRRVVTGRGDFSRIKDIPASHYSMAKSEYVDWCSRIFVEPILDLIQCADSDDNMTDRVLTEVNPTDWAYHTKEGLEQMAEKEFHKDRKADSRLPSEPCDSLVASHESLQTTAIAMSTLRKILYCTDGTNISLLRLENKAYVARRFAANGGNSFTTDKTSTMIVINDMSREMLLCGSDAGIIRIWDPSFNIHSHDIDGTPQLVTTALPLVDQLRQTMDKDEPVRCIYDWCQSSGRVVCGGNVKVVRVWDAHCERTTQDVVVGTRCGAVTALSADLDNSHLVAVGFRSGSLHVHDLRIPSRSSRILRFEERSTRMVGCALRVNPAKSGGDMLVTANDDGYMCVFEPRMFQEPVVEVNMDSDRVLGLEVHNNGNLIGCSVQTGYLNEVKLYDARGTSQGTISMNMLGAGHMSRVRAMAMHSTRCLVAVADDNLVGVYTKKSTIF